MQETAFERGLREAITAPPDPVVLGLERKLDVLRAQLAACRAGRDPGEAGIETWSRLEQQSQRILALEAELARSVAEAASLREACRAAEALLARSWLVRLLVKRRRR